MADELKQLIKKRGTYKARLTLFEKYVNTLLDEISQSGVMVVERPILIELESRVDRQEVLLSEFNQIQNSIEELHENIDEQMLERESFEKIHYRLVSVVKNFIYEKTTLLLSNEGKGESSAAKPHNSARQLPHITLPQIKLPIFKGSYETWLEFRDTFLSLVHKRPDLDDVEKFHYVRSHLDGEAKQVIGSIEFSAENYKVAWDLLCERYNNKRLLIQNHIKSLLDISPLSKESAVHLRNMVDNVSKHLRALNTLAIKTKEWDVLLIYLLGSKLDKKTEREWEECQLAGDLPTLEEFKAFLKRKADILEKLDINHGVELKVESKHDKFKSNKSFVATVQNSCGFCKKEHYITNCVEFLKLSTYNRSERVRQLKLCLNCLKANHVSKDCRASTCRKCNSRHHTLLHFERQASTALEPPGTVNTTRKEEVSENSLGSNSNNAIAVSNCNLVQSNNVLLSTALVHIVGSSGEGHTCRVLLDSGSQSNFISANLCSRLGVEKSSVNISIVGISRVVSSIKHRCEIRIQSLCNAFEMSISCLVLPKICENIPNLGIPVAELNIPKHLRLADPSFYKPGEVDLLLGADVFYNLLCNGQIRLGTEGPILQKTVFGWVVSGSVPSVYQGRVHCSLSTKCDVQNQLAKFWELEEISPGNISLLSEDEKQCENIFATTTKRNSDGRFIVKIPLKESPSKLGDSRHSALKRFYSLENKLQKNSNFKQMYVQFMQEYIDLGHMSKVSEISNSGNVCYYLPHHGVMNEKSITTKLRVVFDASCVSDSGLSLNDLQYVGATIQNDLVSIIIRFRLHKIVVCADVAKMYRMVLVDPSQRGLQCIFWRSNVRDELSVYQLNTVTYGTASAPFLAVRCLKELADENAVSFPTASRAILDDFYVDDFISGAETVQEAVQLCSEVSSILKSGCFTLRKWTSNSADVLNSIQVSDISSGIMQFGDKENTKMLGLYWSCQSDVLMYKIKELLPCKTITKRSILSDIAQIFDPLGLLSPSVVKAKLILQKLWSLKLSWDEAVPSDLHFYWQQYREQLSELNHLEIPRRVVCENLVKLEIHGFADSSQECYGACVYLRSTDANNKIHVSLLCSKTKVAPLKLVTIPRLELCAALILAQLVNKVQLSLKQRIDSISLWSDSTVALGWIKTSSHLFQTFVANRVSQIQTLSDINNWHHVSTKSNPADLLSRGVNPSILGESTLWWHGPEWLSMMENSWPRSKATITGELPELKAEVKSFPVTRSESFPFERFSNFVRMKRVLAYCLRFVSRCQRKPSQTGALTSQELEAAFMCLVKFSQGESFPIELRMLRKGGEIKSKGGLLSLSPFIDPSGILRVGGRLELSDFEYDKKHPILLSSKHPLTKLLFVHEHRRLLHAGPNLLLSSIRERFWPISGRNLAKRVIHDCIKCYRAKPSQIHPMMGMLPKTRIQPMPPFHVTGVDYAGPFLLKDRRGRGARLSKCYVSLFVCFTTKAIHLELVSDLTTKSFIAAFRRFVSRRGRPAHVYSDNGKNFVGANAELRELEGFLLNEGESLTDSLHNEGVDWHFIPVNSPHFGGLWEAGVKATKFHLKRVLANASLTFEHFGTVLTQIEAILNSRPLTPLSSDPNDLDVLTPSHFLIGKSMTSLPDPRVIDLPLNRLSRFQFLQSLQQHFWSRWAKEYISELQKRVKWKTAQEELKAGTMVLIRDDKLPPLRWNLGRIIEVHPGKDGVVRVATIKTKCGVIKRAFAKICPLPIDES